MAKAFNPPKGYDFEYSFSNFDLKSYQKAEEDYIERLRQWVKANSDSNHEAIGKVIRTPRADSYALYMVLKVKPLQLIHIPVGDAWHADPAWIRGLRLVDVVEMVRADERLRKLFATK